MWPVVVIIVHPYPYLLSYLVDVLEDEPVQGSSPETAVEPFHESVLGRFAGLYVFELYAVHPAPSRRKFCDELGAVVHTYALGLFPSVDQMVQDPDHPVAGQGKIHFDMKCLPVVVVHDIECLEAAFVLQNVGDKIHALGMIGFRRDLQRFFYACRQTFLRLSSQRQSERFVNTMDTFMVPWPSFRPQTMVGHPETFLGMFLGLLSQGPFYLGIVLW